VKVKEASSKPLGRISFMQDPKIFKQDPSQSSICNLDIALPGYAEGIPDDSSQNNYVFLKEARNGNIFTKKF
jgi:hypothetical protein